MNTPRPTPYQIWRTSLLCTAASCSGPRVCLRNARSTETMMLVSRHSRKQMKKTVHVGLVTHITVARLTWNSENIGHLEIIRQTASSRCRRYQTKEEDTPVAQEGRSNQMSRPGEKKRSLCPSTLYQDGSRISGASISHWQSLHVSMAPPIVKRSYPAAVDACLPDYWGRAKGVNSNQDLFGPP
jgi:hypothetical protein